MKPVTVIFLIVIILISCRTRSGNDTGFFDPDSDGIQIVLFHMAHRCESCDSVELVTEQLLEEEYWDAFATGKVRFVPLNYQSENGKKAARLLKATGQTLYVVKGDSIDNLTSPAFMYAATHPDYYRDALREALDKFLK
jgi:hypothetical protein